MKKLQFTVRDKSTGKVGKVRALSGNSSAFTMVKIAYKDNSPSRVVPISHVELLTLNGLNTHRSKVNALEELQETNKSLYSALRNLVDFINHPSLDADEAIKEIKEAESALIKAEGVI